MVSASAKGNILSYGSGEERQGLSTVLRASAMSKSGLNTGQVQRITGSQDFAKQATLLAPVFLVAASFLAGLEG